MALKKFLRGDIWYLRGTVRGQAVYERTGTCDADAAEAIRIKRENDLLNQSVYGKHVVATFADLAVNYLEKEERRPGTKALVARLLRHYQTTKLKDIEQNALDKMYKALVRPGGGPSAKLNLFGCLYAMLEHGARRGMCPRPLLEKPRVVEKARSFFYPEQATKLVRNSALHLRPLLIFLFTIGCRPDEALRLGWHQVDLRRRRVTVVLGKTGGREHIAELRPVTLRALQALPHREGRVFRTWMDPKDTGSGGLGPAYTGSKFRSAYDIASGRAKLPGEWRQWVNKRGERLKLFKPTLFPYCVRHSHATWDYCLHKDLQRLRDLVGWTTTRMAEHYAKRMAEEYSQDVADWFDGKVDLGLAEFEEASCKIRALTPVPGAAKSRPRRKAA